MSKNILIVASKFPPEYSGPGVRITRLYKWLEDKNNNYDVSVICNGIEETTNETYLYKNLSVRRIAAATLNKFFLTLSFLPKRFTHAVIYQYEFLKTFFIVFLSKKYKNINFIHVVGHSGGTSAVLLWAKLKQIPTLLELVNSTAKPYQKFLFFFKVSIPKTGKIAFLTKNMADLHQSNSIKKEHIWIKPNPVDVQKFNIDIKIKYSLRKDITPFSEDDLIILSIAKFMPRKNQILLVSILNFLPQKYKLVLAGPSINKGIHLERDKKYFQSITELINKYNLQNRIHVINGYVESEHYIKMADIYAMPAWDEGLGTPMLEAMACGLPVISNEAEPAFREWITDGENGFLTSINNPKQWADNIIKASKFKEEQKIKISQKIYSKISQEKIFSEYEKIFTSFLKI